MSKIVSAEFSNTYGNLVAKAQSENPITDKNVDDAIAQTRALWHADLIEKRDGTIEHALKDSQFSGKDFYVVQLLLKDNLTAHPRSLSLARHSCPTPMFHQSVYKYHRESGSLKFLWALPERFVCEWMIRNMKQLPPDFHASAQCVALYYSGELLDWVKKENGNKPDGLMRDTNNVPYIIETDSRGELIEHV